MELKCLDKYSLANIIANTVNFKIKKEIFKNDISFSKVLNIINEYKEIGFNDIIKSVNFVICSLNMFEKEKEKEIVKEILDNIYFNFKFI